MLFQVHQVPRRASNYQRTIANNGQRAPQMPISNNSPTKSTLASNTYCWYPCMLENRNKASGFVTLDRSCTLSPVTTISPTATLSSVCYSLSGSHCDWSTNCLKKKYLCKASSTAYAVKYAHIFCAVYKAHYSTYSYTGQDWMNRARKCLQSSLVPLLRPWVKPTCQDIRRKALNSHTSCFLKPDNQQTSICNLNCND